jgi:hypothetical protein
VKARAKVTRLRPEATAPPAPPAQPAELKLDDAAVLNHLGICPGVNPINYDVGHLTAREHLAHAQRVATLANLCVSGIFVDSLGSMLDERDLALVHQVTWARIWSCVSRSGRSTKRTRRRR